MTKIQMTKEEVINTIGQEDFDLLEGGYIDDVEYVNEKGNKCRITMRQELVLVDKEEHGKDTI